MSVVLQVRADLETAEGSAAQALASLQQALAIEEQNFGREATTAAQIRVRLQQIRSAAS
jgi:hypothetical protein